MQDKKGCLKFLQCNPFITGINTNYSNHSLFFTPDTTCTLY